MTDFETIREILERADADFDAAPDESEIIVERSIFCFSPIGELQEVLPNESVW